ncbi:MAG: hypothetical protein RIR18_492 [Pseudomonadota bacterium]|jgi:hypothetical protein
MLQRNLCAAAVMLACTPFIPIAEASSSDDLKEIRQQIAAMKAQYETRISYLENKLAQVEAKPSVTEVVPVALPEVVQSSGFNPEISLILDGKFGSTQRAPATYAIQGFVPNGGEIKPPGRGFSLGETELGFSANVDHLFRANVRLSIADDGGTGSINTEEAHIETLGLGDGLKVKAGRFLSGIGYLNAQHPHEWDFVDAPLAYKVFWGSRLSQDGVQAKWVAPTDVFLELGSEVAHGASFPGATNERSTPANGALFAHLGGEWNASNAWQTGLSYVRSDARGRTYTDGAGTENSFDGASQTWIANFVWKWAPNGNSSVRSFKLQSELFSRTEEGDMIYDTKTTPVQDNYRSRQTGGYAQAVYQFMPKWRVGYRYDWLDSGSVDLGPNLSPNNFAELASYRPRRNSVMLDWSPSEFSRLRLQLARDESRGEGLGDNQFFLQYIMSIGAHGAHKF